MMAPAQKWTGNCSWCGRSGDASSLFCYSAVTRELGSGRPSQFQFCSALTTDSLEQWVKNRDADEALKAEPTLPGL
jgi:hypothetical protein